MEYVCICMYMHVPVYVYIYYTIHMCICTHMNVHSSMSLPKDVSLLSLCLHGRFFLRELLGLCASKLVGLPYCGYAICTIP